MPFKTRWDKLVELNEAVRRYLSIKEDYENNHGSASCRPYSDVELAKLDVADWYLISEGIPTTQTTAEVSR